MARIYNSVNESPSLSGLLARNLYTSEQIEYKLRQKADKVSIYTKVEIDKKITDLTSLISNNKDDFDQFSSTLNQAGVLNNPLKWTGTTFSSCLNSLNSDGISPTPLGWDSNSKSLISLFPTLDSGLQRGNSNSGLFLGRQTIIRGGNFNTDSLQSQQDPLLSEYDTEVYPNSLINWSQFEPNNRLISKHSVDPSNSALGDNSLFTGELAININTGDIFVGWQGKSLDSSKDVFKSGIKTLFSPELYVKVSPSLEQIIKASSNVSSLIVKGNDIQIGDENARADIAQFYTKNGNKKTYINAVGDLNTEILNINQSPIPIGNSSLDFKIAIKVLGQTYYIPVSLN